MCSSEIFWHLYTADVEGKSLLNSYWKHLFSIRNHQLVGSSLLNMSLNFKYSTNLGLN